MVRHVVNKLSANLALRRLLVLLCSTCLELTCIRLCVPKIINVSLSSVRLCCLFFFSSTSVGSTLLAIIGTIIKFYSFGIASDSTLFSFFRATESIAFGVDNVLFTYWARPPFFMGKLSSHRGFYNSSDIVGSITTFISHAFWNHHLWQCVKNIFVFVLHENYLDCSGQVIIWNFRSIFRLQVIETLPIFLFPFVPTLRILSKVSFIRSGHTCRSSINYYHHCLLGQFFYGRLDFFSICINQAKANPLTIMEKTLQSISLFLISSTNFCWKWKMWSIESVFPSNNLKVSTIKSLGLGSFMI